MVYVNISVSINLSYIYGNTISLYISGPRDKKNQGYCCSCHHFADNDIRRGAYKRCPFTGILINKRRGIWMFFQGFLTKGIRVGELKYVYFKHSIPRHPYKNSYMYVHLLSGTFEQKIENPMTKKLSLFNQSKMGGEVKICLYVLCCI